MKPEPADLHIKNMVCQRCIKVVRQLAHDLQLPVEQVGLGTLSLAQPLSTEQRQQLETALAAEGFELIDDRRSRLTEQIKRLIIGWVRTGEEARAFTNTSVRLQEALGYDYHYLSSLFSSTEGITIEKYLIAQKIERAKELLVYDEKTLTEIADELGYSSVQHLSNQFRKTTGLSPSHFKKVGQERRKGLDEVGT